MFGGVSGSAIADTAAIGSLVIPTMVQRGYSRAFAAALLAVAGTLALLMPLSIPFLVYAFISGVSMRQLSMAGVVPAFITAAALVAVCVWYGRKSGCDNGDGARIARRDLGARSRMRVPRCHAGHHRRRHLVGPLHADRIGGGGGDVWARGVAVPLQGHHVARPAAIAAVRIPDQRHRDAGHRRDRLPRLAAHRRAGGSAAGGMGARRGARAVDVPAARQYRLLLLGIFIEPLPALLLTAPLFLPLAKAFHIDLVHLGVVMTANLAIALYTPPVGGTLFVAAKLAGAGIGDITRALMPLMAASVSVLFLVTYWPALTRWLPALLN